MKVVSIKASVPVQPVDFRKVRYDPLDDAYVHTGTYPVKYPNGRGIFLPNQNVWLIFIVIGLNHDEPQVTLRRAGPEARFHTNAIYNSIPHKVFMAYSAGDLGTESSARYLNNRTRVVYSYSRALIPEGLGSYQIKDAGMPVLTKEVATFDLSKSVVLDMEKALYYSA